MRVKLDFAKIIFSIVVCSLLAVSTSAFAQASPAGSWKTIDDVTGQPKSIVQITVSGNQLSGRIVKLIPRPGEAQTDICTTCTGPYANKKIVGLRILWGMTNQGGNKWSGGKIMDPKTGKVYDCTITVMGNQLQVRGFIGISLLGRTQTWYRQ